MDMRTLAILIALLSSTASSAFENMPCGDADIDEVLSHVLAYCDEVQDVCHCDFGGGKDPSDCDLDEYLKEYCAYDPYSQ